MMSQRAQAAMVAVAWPALVLCAQEPAFRSGSTLVTVPVTVTDRSGHFVRGLAASDFEILEDGQSRPVAQFTANRVPLSVAILLDVSGSMSTEPARWDLTRRAVASFMSRLEERDEVTLIVFNERPVRVGGWTRHTTDVFSALASVRTGGRTDLFRALLGALPVLDEASHQRRVLLLISDGNSNVGTFEFAPTGPNRVRAVYEIRRSGAAVYAIGVGMGAEPVNRRTLGDVSEPTGGYYEVVSSSDRLEAAVGRVADDLRDQYVLGFEPTKTDGAIHRIEVKTDETGHRIRARTGYAAIR
jgi:Ca-activated chloride channel family protein